ncbi:MAG: DUF4091 domain-containing protein [Candidatus Omnitrophica bacterium]|nr:DUF4091 domain-containing protein [Candidatus Omnitrophota bacterium]
MHRARAVWNSECGLVITRWLLLLAALAAGMVAGFAYVQHRNGHPPGASTGAPRGPAPREVWLSDFETQREELIRWQLDDVTAEPSEEHATHGERALKVTFQSGARAPALVMDDFLIRDRARRDWSRYDTLTFDIYNAQPTSERLLLQLRNGSGALYKEEFVIPGESTQHAAVNLRDVVSYLSLSDVAELRLFQWKPAQETTFYVDAFRLQDTGAAAAVPGPHEERVKDVAPEPAPTPVQPASQWQVGWASGLTKIFRDPAMFRGRREGPIRLALARGEYESAQIALIGGVTPARVTVAVGALTHQTGAVIPPGVIEVRRVDYVKTTKPYYPVTHVGSWPDALPEAAVVDVPAKAVQPVWITLGAPDSLPAGRYQGAVTLTDEAGRAESLNLDVTIWDFTLPRTSHLKTAFDLYQGRLERAYREFVPGGAAWEGRFDELRQRYMLNLLKHRVSPVWGADPTTSRFAWDVKRYLDRGLTAFGVGSFGGSHGNNWPEDPVELAQTMVWYRQAAFELSLSSLLNEAYVYTYDEPTPGDPQAAAVMAAIHREAPGLKNLLVMQHAPDPVKHAAWFKDADILCLRITAFDPEQAQRFQAMGKEVWLYVSMPGHPFPSLQIDYPAMAHRVIPWMAWKYGVSGLLYWSVNFWEGDPLTNPAAFAPEQNGDGILYYPGPDGPVPSIRLEVLRDGIEDYEYLVLLQRLAQSAQGHPKVDPALLQQAQRLLAVDPVLVTSLRSYAKDPGVLETQRQQIAATIEKLQQEMK